MNHSVTALYQRHFRFVLATTLAGFVVAAWYMRFLQDDAFISFRYADNLVRGFGLVWNPGDHVEGYTNFLWTLVISAGMAAGLDPVPTSQILGICFFFLTLVFTYRISLLVSRSRTAGLVTIFLLGTNYTFLSYATGGL
ncbi:MAG TPA: hypothetical protein VGR15_02570, partial [Bacteroidota bacterium]|nr:hypothetical protein [Bacteroidota bacterium]